ncbi:MAG: hypothetical protein AAF747_12105 [Planctomycetota bacterium]
MTRKPKRLLVDASDCYWRLVPAADLDHRRMRQFDAAVLLEHVAPVPAESLQCAWQRLPSGDVVTCGVEADTLWQQMHADHTTAGPSVWPAFLSSACRDADIEQLNFLNGHFEPSVITRTRKTWHTGIAIMACIIALFVLIGIEWRIGALRSHIAATMTATNDLVSKAIGDRGIGLASRHHLLIAERRSLEQTRRRPIDLQNAAHTLASIFDAWPKEPRSRAQSIRVESESASFTVLIDGQAEASAFEAAWQADARWRLDQPRITTQRDGVRFVARAIRNDGSGDGS